MMKKDRNQFVDIMRGIAMLLVVRLVKVRLLLDLLNVKELF